MPLNGSLTRTNLMQPISNDISGISRADIEEQNSIRKFHSNRALADISKDINLDLSTIGTEMKRK